MAYILDVNQQLIKPVKFQARKNVLAAYKDYCTLWATGFRKVLGTLSYPIGTGTITSISVRMMHGWNPLKFASQRAEKGIKKESQGLTLHTVEPLGSPRSWPVASFRRGH